MIDLPVQHIEMHSMFFSSFTIFSDGHCFSGFGHDFCFALSFKRWIWQTRFLLLTFPLTEIDTSYIKFLPSVIDSICLRPFLSDPLQLVLLTWKSPICASLVFSFTLLCSYCLFELKDISKDFMTKHVQ